MHNGIYLNLSNTTVQTLLRDTIDSYTQPQTQTQTQTMCGILACLTNVSPESVQHALRELSARGPDKCSTFQGLELVLGFTRLAINGIHDGDQPFLFNEHMHPDPNGCYALICNGELYNSAELYAHVPTTQNTHSDCEIILHLYVQYGMEQTLQLIHGVFAFVLVDMSTPTHKAFIARDPFGVRPLYSQGYHFASEMKALLPVQHHQSPIQTKTQPIIPFPPATYVEYHLPNRVRTPWVFKNATKYFILPPPQQALNGTHREMQNALVTCLYRAVQKRVHMSERPVGCLLSGGLDSSLITAMTAHAMCSVSLSSGTLTSTMSSTSSTSSILDTLHTSTTPITHTTPRVPHVPRVPRILHTFSIGLEGGEDLHYARQVVDHLQQNETLKAGNVSIQHHEIIMTENEFLSSIPDVIRAIESYDTTTVRASVGNYLVAKYIREHTECKVIMNGDGSDEVCGGYMYFHKSPSPVAFDMECRRLLKRIHQFDVLRSDRSVSAHGLEARTPFLDKDFVLFYTSLPRELRDHASKGHCEKELLRRSFSECWPSLLPSSIVWRTKEAFSDGVSKHTRSWHEIIRDHVESMDGMDTPNHQTHQTHQTCEHLPPTTLEQTWYRQLWANTYPKHAQPIPYFWMPRFVTSTDPSARTLACYSSSENIAQ